jgi:hypothetical protein
MAHELTPAIQFDPAKPQFNPAKRQIDGTGAGSMTAFGAAKMADR